MVFENDDVYFKKVIAQCDCGCGELEITQFQPDGSVYMGYSMSAFSAFQTPVWDNIKRWFRMLWAVFTGKSFHLYEVCLSPTDVSDLQKAIMKLKVHTPLVDRSNDDYLPEDIYNNRNKKS